MATSSSVTESGVLLPSYEVVSGSILRQLEHASSVESASTDDEGEFYALLAMMAPAETVPDGSIIIVPLDPPAQDEALDFTFVSGRKSMFVKVHDKPQTRNTYGHVASYSAGTADKPFPVGTLIKFATPANFIVAKHRLVIVVKDATGAEVDLPTDTSTGAGGKRPRQLEIGGELGEDTTEKPKGTSTYLLDLDGVKHFTRNKTDISQRERDLHFIFRAMDTRKWDYCVSTDFVLQTELYRSMVCEQSDTQPEDRHIAFQSCGIMSRVQKLHLFQKKEKLKLLLTGSVLMECTTDPTLSLLDFASEERISNRTTACPSNNVGLIQAIKNFQTVLQIVFADSFATSLEIFIDLLEGANRPMEVVAADFLRYSVELTLRKFFRVVRSVKSTAIPEMSIKNPEECAVYLENLFAKLAADLSDPTIEKRQEAFYRLRLARRNEQSGVVTPAKNERSPGEKIEKASVKFSASPEGETKTIPPKMCSGHMGFQLSARRKDGRPYTCSHGKDCSYRHVSLDGKSKQKLMEMTSAMHPTIRDDLRKSIELRK